MLFHLKLDYYNTKLPSPNILIDYIIVCKSYVYIQDYISIGTELHAWSWVKSTG